eukprot:403368864
MDNRTLVARQEQQTSQPLPNTQGNLDNEEYKSMQIENYPLGHHHKHSGRSLEDLDDRLGFIRKVYGILSMQLIITALMCAIPTYNEASRQWMNKNPWTLFLAFGLMIASMCVIVCSKEQARKVPNNYFLLGFFTVSVGYTVMFATSQYEPRSVLIAAAMTAFMVVALTIYVHNTKVDLDVEMGGLVVFSSAFSIAGLCLLFSFSEAGYILFCTFGVILFGFYILYDTHLIVGGGQHELSSEDYVLGAMIIYLDILNVFLYILRIIGERRD